MPLTHSNELALALRREHLLRIRGALLRRTRLLGIDIGDVERRFAKPLGAFGIAETTTLAAALRAVAAGWIAAQAIFPVGRGRGAARRRVAVLATHLRGATTDEQAQKVGREIEIRVRGGDIDEGDAISLKQSWLRQRPRTAKGAAPRA